MVVQYIAYEAEAGKLPLPPLSSVVSQYSASSNDLKRFLKRVSDIYGQDYQEMANVIFCESSWRTDVYSKGKVSYGIAQFTKATFKDFCVGDYKSPEDQLLCMGAMFRAGLKSRWNCWYLIKK